MTNHNQNLQHLLTLNPEAATPEEVAQYRVRHAARAVVTDATAQVALLHVGKFGYYKLPGGGLDEGEDIASALARECLEEIGCQVDVTDEIGLVEEYRKMFGLHQISYCYRAKVVGEKGTPDFTEKELARGFSIVWVPAAEALQLVKASVTDNPEGRDYIVPRDLCVLRTGLALAPDSDAPER